MATQRTTARPWFRFSSMVRPPAPQVPAAEPAPPQPIPLVARPIIRPVAQPQPAPSEPKPPPAAAAPPPPSPPSPTVLTSPTPSVPTFPAPSASLPTPTVALPVTITSSVPSSPKPRVSAATSSVPSSPASKPVTTSTSLPSSLPTSPAPKPVDSKSSSPSPKTTKPTTATTYVPSPAQPSPLTTPPSKIEPYNEHESKIPPEEEQKNVLFQKTIEKAAGNTHKSSIARTGKQGVAKEVDTEGKAHRKKFYSSDVEGSMRVMTIAGENKGAFMEVIKSPKKNGFKASSSHLLYKKGNAGGSSSDSSSSSEEVNQKMKKDKKNGGMFMNSTPMSAFMNSNIQAVNNSIVYNSSCTHHDPGIHLALSTKPSNGRYHVKNHSSGYNS